MIIVRVLMTGIGVNIFLDTWLSRYFITLLSRGAILSLSFPEALLYKFI